MESDLLQVKMLGSFSIRSGQQEINDSDNRTRKVWLLLAYMIYNRTRSISQAELVSLLWGEEAGSSNPLNALKTMFHRVRAFLNQLESSAGHTLIVRRNGNYAWNPDIPFFFDVDAFDQACQAGADAADEETQLQHNLQALHLYDGDFLQKLSSEPWVVPIAAYYHNLYVQVLLDTLPLLEARSRSEEVVALCRQAVVTEPYNELLYQHLMKNLLAMDDHHAVMTVYEDMSQLLFDNFGILPSKESRALYRQAVQIVNDHMVSISTILDQLREPESVGGALLCDYDFFRIIYQSLARAVIRSGDAIHIALISATDEDGSELPKRSLDRCMENLQNLIRANLRKGDIMARCSVSQFALLLPQANYENSRAVCERVVKMFIRQYPHSPAHLRYVVQPLEPNT